MLKPPKGCAPTMAPVHLRFKYRLPTKNLSRASRICSGVLEYRAPVKPYCESLARASASSKSDRKSTRLNSSHQIISYAVFCLKKKKKTLYDSPTDLHEIISLSLTMVP